MKEILHVLSMLKTQALSFEELLKTGLPENQLSLILEWGESQKLWLREPASEKYELADQGEFYLENQKDLEELLKNYPLELPEDEALSLLEDKELLCRVKEVLDQEIVGEDENKLLLFLLFLSKDLGAEDAQACFIMGSSSSGKSYLLHKLLSFFPEDKVIWLTRSTTHGLEYLCAEKDLTGYILAIEEAPGFEEAQSSIRPIFSEKGLKIVSAQSQGGGKVSSQIIEIKGCPVFVTTSAIPTMDEQMSTRVWILSTDESPEQTRRILAHEMKRAMFPPCKQIEEEKERIRKALSRLKPCSILIPYAQAIKFPTGKIRVRRDFPKLLTLIKVLAFLHQYQRPSLFLEGKEYILATFADYHLAFTLAKKVLRPTLLGLPEGVLMVYETCKELEEAEVEITAKRVTERSQYSQSTVRHYLNELVKARLLLRDESGKEYHYSVIQEKDVALSDVAALESSFSQKGFQNWLSGMMQKDCVSYEELRGHIYNPLSPLHRCNIQEEEKEARLEPEKEEEAALPLNAIEDVFRGKESISKEELIKEFEQKGIEGSNQLVEKLKFKGILFEPEPGILKMVKYGR